MACAGRRRSEGEEVRLQKELTGLRSLQKKELEQSAQELSTLRQQLKDEQVTGVALLAPPSNILAASHALHTRPSYKNLFLISKRF